MSGKVYTKEEIEVFFKQAVEGTLPEDFSDWDQPLSDDERTVAHVAAMYGHLPEDFGKDDLSLWGLKTANGETVAHTAAKYNTLPDYFNQWELTNRYGKSVAEIAVLYHNIPKGYRVTLVKINDTPDTKSGIAIGNGMTVYEDCHVTIWDKM